MARQPKLGHERRERRKRRKSARPLMAGGLLLALGGLGTVAWAMQPDSGTGQNAASTGSAGTGQSSNGTATGSGSASSSAGKNGSSSAGSSSSAAGSSTPSTVAQPKSTSTRTVVSGSGSACVPTRLTVSSVGISGEQVIAMGTNAQGQIYPPAKTTMWYDKSAKPGQDGISVIAGHVTYDGPDNFYNLRKVGVGDRVSITCANGTKVQLQVTHKESVLKTKLTTDSRVWGGSSTPVVVLVTCDDTSKMVAGHYLNNYVVWTRPA